MNTILGFLRSAGQLLTILSCMLLASCSRPPRPVVIEPSPTTSPSSTPSPRPTATKNQPTRTLSLLPTASRTRRPTATRPTPTPTPTATVALYGLGSIVFTGNNDYNYDIFIMRADGQDLTNLTNLPADDRWPAWSPDGKQIAFSSNRDSEQGVYDLYVMNPDGTDVRRLTYNLGVHGSSWSPDGKQMTLAILDDPGWNIYVIDLDTLETTDLTNDPSINFAPAWSPDGDQIAFSSDRNNEDPYYFYPDIYVMDVDGGNLKRLTAEPYGASDPAWSPDGKRIAYTCGGSICIMNADGSDRRIVANAEDFQDGASPSWSPDGLWLTFDSTRGLGDEVYAMSIDGVITKPLTNILEIDTAYDPRWQPFHFQPLKWMRRPVKTPVRK